MSIMPILREFYNRRIQELSICIQTLRLAQSDNLPAPDVEFRLTGTSPKGSRFLHTQRINKRPDSFGRFFQGSQFVFSQFEIDDFLDALLSQLNGDANHHVT